MKNTSWNNLIPGQIISFIYQSKNDKRAVRRFVVVLDPKYIKRTQTGQARLFVGLQLHRQGQRPVPKPIINQAIRLLGGLAVNVDAAGNPYGKQINVEGLTDDKKAKDVTNAEFDKVFNRIRVLVGAKSILRTYDLLQCRKRRVFLETDYGLIPQSAIKVLERQIELGTEVVVED